MLFNTKSIETKCLYYGEVRNRKRNGYGLNYYLNGDKYDGLWRDDKKDEYGIFYGSNGDKYDGEWKDDNRNQIFIYISFIIYHY